MPRRSHLILAGLWFLWGLALCFIASDVGGIDFFWGSGLTAIGLGLAIGWLIQLLLAAKARSRATLALLACEAVFVVCGYLLAGSGLPFRLRFRLSETALTEYANGRLHGGRAGLFAVQSMAPDSDVVLLESGNWGFFQQGGFAYSSRPLPESTAANQGESSYRHIKGPWYRWTKTMLMD